MIYKKYPFVKQQDLKDCGVCSLRMVIEYYHGYIELETLRLLTHTTRKGVSAYHIIEAAQKLGFHGYGIKTNLEEYDLKILPVIAYVKLQTGTYHYVVLYKIDAKRKKILMADPAFGFRKLSFFEFEQIWQNIFIVLYPVKNIPTFGKKHSLKKLYWDLFKNNFNSYVRFIVFSLLLGIFTLFLSFYLEWILDGINKQMPKSYFYFISFFFIILYFFQYFSEYIQKCLFFNLSKKLNLMLTTTFVNRLLFLPYQYYFHRTTGEIVQKLNDLNAIETFFEKLIIFMGLDIWLLFFSFVILSFINSTIFFLLLFIFIIHFIFFYYSQKIDYQNYFLLQQKKEEVTNYLSEMVHGFESIKGMHIEKTFANQFLKSQLLVIKRDIKYHLFLFFQQFLKDYMKEIFFILVITITIFSSFENPNLPVRIFTIQTLLHYYFLGMNNLQELIVQYPKAKQIYERISFLEESCEEKKQLSFHLSGRIQVCHLTYTYDDLLPILDNVSFEISRGEKVLLLGPTGSGKSTLLKLLLRYFPVAQNQILFDETDINMISTETLENTITYVDQNGTLFSDTLYQNIVLYRKVESETFLEVIKLCRVDEIISKRQLGIHVKLEENGFNLSGGERFRIMLARALLNPFQILLIDECFSSMNQEMEYQILKQLFWKYPDKTMIIISHRTSSIDLFDKKYYLKKGVLKAL